MGEPHKEASHLYTIEITRITKIKELLSRRINCQKKGSRVIKVLTRDERTQKNIFNSSLIKHTK